jgi:hypothetical protein
MPIDVTWYDIDKTIIVLHFPDQWTWLECGRAIDTSIQMELSVTHRVDVIADFDRGFSLPAGAIRHIHHAMAISPPNVGTVVITNTSEYARIFLAILSKPYRKLADMIQLVNTFEDAVAFIEEERQAHSAKLA